jgi:hypothetical protein
MHAAAHDFVMQPRTFPSKPDMLFVVRKAQPGLSPLVQRPMSSASDVLALHDESPQHSSRVLPHASYRHLLHALSVVRAALHDHLTGTTTLGRHASLQVVVTHVRTPPAVPDWASPSPSAHPLGFDVPHASIASRMAECPSPPLHDESLQHALIAA